MSRHYVQRLASVSQLLSTPGRAVLAPSLSYIHPTANTQRLLQTSSTVTSALNTKQSTIISNSKRSLYSTATNTLRSTTFATKHEASIPSVTEDAVDPVSDSSNNNPEAFNFIAYAAWHPKNRSPKQRKSQNKIPYWKQLKAGKVDAGEDAFYHTFTPNGLSIGVADGVGGKEPN